MFTLNTNVLRIRAPAVHTFCSRSFTHHRSHTISAAMPSLPPQITPQPTESLFPGMIKWINHCNNGISSLSTGEFIKFSIDINTPPLGYLTHTFAQQILPFSNVFTTQPDGSITLVPSLVNADLDARSAAVASVLESLRSQGAITGWRSELYPVQTSFYESPSLLLERAAAPLFGIKAYGIHINGYIVDGDGTKKLWVARRSLEKPSWPGCLDHIVAGGQPYGLSLQENVVKECEEEAGIPREVAERAVPVGVVSYMSLQRAGLKRDVLFCYDLELPADFIPQPIDGEVHEFFLLPLDQVATIVGTTTCEQDNSAAHPDTDNPTNVVKKDIYKDNCNLVVIDFLVRHGELKPDVVGYVDIVNKLRSGDCS